MNKEAENNRAVLNQVSQSIPSESSNVGLGTRQIMEILWLCPAGILFSVIVIINVQLSKKLRRSRELLGVRGKVKIYRTVYMKKPCLYGLFRPVIYLPEHMTLSAEEQEQIILHEMVHYRHGDPIWTAVRIIFLSLYWYNPFIWLAVIYSRKDAEFACDESVIREIGEQNRFFYGKVLLKLSGSMEKKEFLYMTAQMSNRGRDMEKRIRIISQKKKTAVWIVILFCLLCIIAIGITSGKKQTKQQSETVKTTSQRETALPSPWKEYNEFLKKTAGENQYYSLAALGNQKENVLVISEKVQEISNYNYGSCGKCKIYGMVDGKVTLCGEVFADAQNDSSWLLFWDNQIIIWESDSITKIKREKNQDQLQVENRAFKRNDKKSISAFIQWQNEIKYGDIKALIFYQNPYTEGSTREEPEKLSINAAENFYIKKAYVENERISFGDFTQDGVEDFIDAAMDKVKNPKDDELDTVVLKSGRTGKTLWGLPVNTVHAGWYGVYAYGEKDKRYLLVFQPTMYQGMADFKYKIFTVDESGKETVLHSDQIQFDLNHPKKTDFVSFENFVEKLNQYLKQSELVISTLEGTVLTEENTPSDLTYDPTEILQEMKQDGQ